MLPRKTTSPESFVLDSKFAILRASGDTLLAGNLAKLSLDRERDVLTSSTNSR